MQLLMSPFSPFVRMARITAREAGIALEEREIATSPLATDAALAAANPVGKIPALIRPEGPTLFDSRVICRFLDAQGGAGLYPEERLWDVLTLEALGHGIAEAAVSMTYEARFRPEALRFDDWTEAQWAKITRGLGALEAQWMGLLAGPLTGGQIAVGAALGYLDLRHGARAWRDEAPALADWAEGIFARPSFAETAPV